MKINVTIAATLLALWPLAQAEVPRDNGKADGAVRSVSELKALHTDMLAQIKTVVLEEKVVELRKGFPRETDEEFRTELIGTYITAHAQAVRSVQGQGLGIEQVAKVQSQLEAQLEEELASVDNMVIVARLDRTQAFTRTMRIDLGARVLRYDIRDLRNVDRLAMENGLTEADLMSLDKSGSQIIKRDGSVELVPRADKLALILPHPVYTYDEHAYALGLLPKWVFSSGLELEINELVPTVSAELQLIGRRDGALRFVAVLSAAAGYRATSFTTFNDEKPFQQYSMSDFRKVGDVLIPYRTVYRLDVEGVNRLVERREVRSARVNDPVAPDAFSIPADYRVQEMAGGLRD